MSEQVKIGQVVVTSYDIGKVIKLGDCGGYVSEQIISKEAFIQAFEEWILPRLEIKMDIKNEKAE